MHPDETQQRLTKELERQHYNELLALWYVALTRAKHWLMVSARVPVKTSVHNLRRYLHICSNIQFPASIAAISKSLPPSTPSHYQPRP
jgi:ATP-dependent exoDNAse (exonuclease V) beta subunit